MSALTPCGRRRVRRCGATVVLVLAASAANASDCVARTAQRGPPTVIVGTLFTLASPALMLSRIVRAQPADIYACRLGHGMKMIIAGAVLLPVGLLLAPLHVETVPAAWLDGIVDAFQEDYCTRPWATVMP